MNDALEQQAEELAAQPYSLVITPDETTDGEPIFVLSRPELPGCMAQGFTVPEALANLQDATREYILSLLEDGLPVPPPAVHGTGTTTHVVDSRYDSKDMAGGSNSPGYFEESSGPGQSLGVTKSAVDEYSASDKLERIRQIEVSVIKA